MTDLEEMIRAVKASESDLIETAAIAVLDAVKAAGAVSLMPSPAMPLTGILMHVNPKVYDRVRALTKEGPPPPETRPWAPMSETTLHEPVDKSNSGET